MTHRKLVRGVVLAAVLILGACVPHKDPTGPEVPPPPPEGPADMAARALS